MKKSLIAILILLIPAVSLAQEPAMAQAIAKMPMGKAEAKASIDTILLTVSVCDQAATALKTAMNYSPVPGETQYTNTEPPALEGIALEVAVALKKIAGECGVSGQSAGGMLTDALDRGYDSTLD